VKAEVAGELVIFEKDNPLPGLALLVTAGETNFRIDDRHRQRLLVREANRDDIWLTDREAGTLAGFRIPARRRDWLRGRRYAKWLIRQVLSEMASDAELLSTVPRDDEIDISATDTGAPGVSLWRRESAHESASDCLSGWWPWYRCLSISHRDGLAAAVLGPPAGRMSSGSGIGIGVGIDLEKIEPRPRLFAESFFHESEVAILAQLDARQRIVAETGLWSLKESLLKATQHGLRKDTASFAVTWSGFSDQEWREESVACSWLEPGSARVFHRRQNDFVLTLAVVRNAWKPANDRSIGQADLLPGRKTVLTARTGHA
jgi:phosphopantetheinyl transferase (holo-ACP synthase)